MRFRYTLLYIMAAFLLLTTCTEVDLCEGDHPHRTDIRMSFQFGNQRHPDTMIVFAVRNLNLLTYTYRINLKEGKGWLEYPADLREPLDSKKSETEQQASKTTETEVGEGAEEGTVVEEQEQNRPYDRICLHAGEYDLVAFNGDTTIYSNNLEEITLSPQGRVDSLQVTYKSYRFTQDHPKLARYGDWSTHNTYSDFIIGADLYPTFAAQQSLSVPVYESKESHFIVRCQFEPTNLSQQVNISFQIKKDPGVGIDSILCEISGIPHRIYLMTGSIDVDRTFKTLFKPSVPSDNVNSGAITANGTIWVNGLVRSADPNYITGPGILWVNVYAYVMEDGKKRGRSAVACINLYNLLGSHPSLHLNENDEIVQTTKTLTLTIPAPAILDIKKGTLSSETGIGIDRWVPAETIGMDL